MPTGPRAGTARRWVEAGIAIAAAVTVVVLAFQEYSSHGEPDGTRPMPLSQDLMRTAPLRGAPVFADEFDGAAGAPAPTGNWRASVGGSGFGNHELECNTDARDTSSLDGAGHLVLTALYAPRHRCPDGQTNDYVSARLTTSGLKARTYGRVRVRAQLPTGTGTWPGIWALGQDIDTAGYPASGEIDIAEAVGRTPGTIYQTLRGPNPQGNAYSIQTATTLGAPASAAFHVYGADWTANSVTFSVDGRVTRVYSKDEVERTGSWVFDKPFFLLLSLAVGGDFPGTPRDPSVYPQRMVIDYVRVYA